MSSDTGTNINQSYGDSFEIQARILFTLRLFAGENTNNIALQMLL